MKKIAAEGVGRGEGVGSVIGQIEEEEEGRDRMTVVVDEGVEDLEVRRAATENAEEEEDEAAEEGG